MKGMGGMMKQIQKMQAEMERVQNELGNKTIDAESGGGIVKVTANGKKEIVKIEIGQEVINPEEKEMLEDLVVAAVNKALEAAGKMAEEELANVTKGMIPPGLNIPGF
ncbi:MAG: YbaB/EbfC family nucleoid-associated protein [Melioribacteraceae bacterium]|jgi:DNA-binding YbaB/EbfC family protein|nr:hypothetical protein [Ignavibacteriota bacterium]MBZ0184131.1 YbaB/EbfC family nucleoid-associated protein [Melioribacteraceae bacterium]